MIIAVFIFLCLVSILLKLGRPRPPRSGWLSQGYTPPRPRLTFWDTLGYIIMLCLGFGAMLCLALGWLGALLGAHHP